MRHNHILLTCLILFLLTLGVTTAQDSPAVRLDQLRDIANADLNELAPLMRIGRGWGYDLAWTPDGETLALATSVGIWLYDADDLDAEPFLLQTGPEAVTALAYSPDGRLLAAGGHTIHLWDTSDRQLVRTFPADGPVVSLAFSPDGTTLVSSNRFGAQRYSVSLWDVQSGAEIRQLGEYVVDGLTFSPDGALIAGVSMADCCFSVIMWDAATGENVFHSSVGVRAAADRVIFSPDSTTLAVIDRTGSIVFLDSQDPYADGDVIVVPEGEDTSDWYPPGANYTPDGERLAALSGLGNLRVWDTESLEMVSEIALDWEAVAALLSPDGALLAAVNEGGDVRIWGIESGELAAERNGLIVGGKALAFSPDGALLATVRCEVVAYRETCGQETLWLWDVATGEPASLLAEHEGLLQDVVFNADGTLLAAASDDGTARVWQVASNELLYTITAHAATVRFVIFGSDGELLTAGDDVNIRFWDAAMGEPLPVPYDIELQIDDSNVLTAPTTAPLALAYDGDTLAISDYSGSIYLWRRDRQDAPWLLVAQDYFSRNVNALALNHEGFLVSGGANNVVQLWNSYAGGYLGTATVHDSWIYSLAFSPTWYGLVASAGCADSLRNPWEGSPYCAGADLRLWNAIVYDDESHVVPQAHTMPIREVIFNPVGTLLATTGDDGTILLWGIQPEE